MFGQITLVGFLGRDCELRFTPSGKAVADFSMAVNTGWGDHQITSWYKITLWQKRAESLTPYLTKGSRVLVIGTLQADPSTGGPRTWTDSDGNARSSFEVTAREIVLLGSKSEPEETTQSEIPF